MKQFFTQLKFKELIYWLLAIICFLSLSLTVFSQEKPGPDNTGYKGTLSEWTASDTISEEGAIVENVIIHGGIYIFADNVTVRNCFFIGGINGIWAKYGYGNLLVEDCEFIEQSSCAIFGSNFTIRRCNIHEGDGDGIKPNTNAVIEYNYIHHLGMAPDSHADGIQSRSGGTNMIIRYNNIDMPIGLSGYRTNAAIFFEYENGEITNTYIEYNWLNGGNMTVQSGWGKSVYCSYNKFGRDYRYNTFRSGVANHSCNVWEDNGEPIDACDEPVVATPIIAPKEGVHNSPVPASLSCITPGAEIRYTVDGSEPTRTSQVYTGPFTVSSTTTVMARAYKAGMLASLISSAVFEIDSGNHNGDTVLVTGVNISQSSIKIEEGLSSDLNETVLPSNATTKYVTWSSSNTSVAIVDGYGLVTAISAGTATVTATTADGGYTANCLVEVSQSIAGPYTLTITGATADQEIRSDQSLQFIGNTSLRVGGASSLGGCGVFPFQLPALAPEETIQAASFKAYLEGIANNPPGNVDAYGLAYRASNEVQASDYWQGSYNTDADNIAIVAGFATPSTSKGYVTTEEFSLVDYVNAQYANGAQGGDYIFIRLNSDQADMSNYKFWKFTTANGDNKPILELEIAVNSSGNQTTNISKTHVMAFNLFPNPSSNGTFNIILERNDLVGNYELCIYDISGKKVYADSDILLDNQETRFKTDLQGGIYVVTLCNNSQVYIKKLIIE